MNDLEALFERYRARGDVDALARMFDLAAPRLLRVARHLARDEASAEDLVQATFVAAIESSARFDGGRAVMPWLTGILGNKARRAQRAPDPERLSAPRGEDPVCEAEVREFARALERAMERVPDAYRDVLREHLGAGKGAHEIARASGQREGTVRVQLVRGLAHLRRLLPAGLALGGVAVITAPRGLGAVKTSVMVKAATQAPVASSAALTILGGTLMSKTTVAVAGVCLAALIAWWAGSRGAESQGSDGAPLTPSTADTELAQSAPEPDAAQPEHDAPARRSASSLEPTVVKSSLGALEVSVVWPDGEPAADVGVRIARTGVPSPYRIPYLRRTDEEGRVALAELEAGEYVLRLVRGDPNGYEHAQVVAGERCAVRLELPPGEAVGGRVVDVAGEGVAGATIWQAEAGFFEGATAVAESGPDGEFALRDLNPRRCVFASAEGEGISNAFALAALPRDGDGARVAELTLLGAGAALTGLVTDPEGAPVDHARVRLACAGFFTDQGYVDPEPLIVRTDARGEFRAPGLRAGTVELLVSAVGHPLWRGELMLFEGRLESADVQLVRGVAVEGQVTDRQGRPLRAQVSQSLHLRGNGFHDVTAFSDEAEGRFRLEGIAPGEFELTVYASVDGEDRSQRQTLHGIADQVVRWDPVVGGGPRILGRATDERGVALAGWSVRARPNEDEHGVYREARTQGDGSFELLDCSEGSHRLRLYAPGAGNVHCAELPDVVSDGDPVVLVALDAERVSARIVGRVLDAEGAPIPEAEVQIGTPDFRHNAFTRCDSEGAFRSDLLAPGVYRAIVSAVGRSSLSFGPLELVAEQELDVGDIAFSAPGRVELSVSRSDGVELKYPRVALIDAAGVRHHLSTEDWRVFTSPELQPGEYGVLADVSNGGPIDERVLVRSNETTRADLVLPPGTSVTLRFEVSDPGLARELLHVVVRDAAGVARIDGRYPSNERPEGTFYYASTGYVPGLYEYSARGAGFTPVEGTFEVMDAAAAGRRIDHVLEGAD